MNYTAVARMTWKEYRAVRAFWLALIVLTLFVQCLLIGVLDDSARRTVLICSFALGAPAFFALGCAGTSFAIEREDGTFDFLRASPATIREVLTSKWVVALAATVGMFLVLWPVALALTGGKTPEPLQLKHLLGLWLLAAVEALVWGTFFSIVCARPLTAISLAIFTASTVTHLLSWTTHINPIESFDLARYSAALPLRLLVVALVAGLGVWLGLRWLDSAEPRRRGRGASAPAAAARSAPVTIFPAGEIAGLAQKADRGAMFGRLFWQQLRQSRWQMALLGGQFLVLGWMTLGGQAFGVDMFPFVIMVLGPLLGCFVFQRDQEQRGFRFFVEHNVPPRYVWLSRQVPWIVMTTAITAFLLLAWVKLRTIIGLWLVVQSVADPWRGEQNVYDPQLQIPPVMLGLSGVALTYAAGQWCSMMISSGLLASSLAILLGGLLCGWAFLMDALGVGWWWSVAPIPLVLLWATWWRAPDWVRENSSWPARGRAAAAVGLPAILLLVAVPWYRVHEIPLVKPGLDSEAYLATFTRPAKDTADLYLRAGEQYMPSSEYLGIARGPQYRGSAALTPAETEWLNNNKESLNLVLEASRRPECAFGDPTSDTGRVLVRSVHRLPRLVVASARQLEGEGKLDESLDRYFAAIKVISQLSDPGIEFGLGRPPDELAMVFSELEHWALAKDQTAERIGAAIKRLAALDDSVLQINQSLEFNFVLARRYVHGDPAARSIMLYSNDKHPVPMLWPRLMPWETYRGLRELNHLSEVFRQVDLMRRLLAEGKGVVDFLPTLPQHYSADYVWGRDEGWGEYRHTHSPRWLDAIRPNLLGMTLPEHYQMQMLAAFEAHRRGAMIVMALEAYRLDHGSLPAKLDDLAGKYLASVPNDPYWTGQSFKYFPDGLPEARTPLEAKELESAQRMTQKSNPRLPGVWCTGPTIVPAYWGYEITTAEEDEKARSELTYYLLRNINGDRMSMYVAWARGNWFPIPERPQP